MVCVTGNQVCSVRANGMEQYLSSWPDTSTESTKLSVAVLWDGSKQMKHHSPNEVCEVHHTMHATNVPCPVCLAEGIDSSIEPSDESANSPHEVCEKHHTMHLKTVLCPVCESESKTDSPFESNVDADTE
jgi:hypothetical protein